MICRSLHMPKFTAID